MSQFVTGKPPLSLAEDGSAGNAGAGAEPGRFDAPEALTAMLAALARLSGAGAAAVRVTGSTPGQLETCAVFGPPVESGADRAHVVGIPMRLGGQVVGTIDLLFPGPGALAPDALPLLAAAGDVLAAALETARRARADLAEGLVNERRMMAGEVHDSLAQGLTYMRMRMSLLRDAIRQGDEVRAYKYWNDVDSALTNAHRRLRELITYFRTRMDPRGLVSALADMSTSFLDRTGVALEFDNQVPGLELPVGREVQVFHIVQEALANVVKHANARRARLALRRANSGFEIVVEDDGVGMAAGPTAGEQGEGGHYGIAIMRERARRLGGELTLESTPGAGTRVRLYFPAVQPQSEEGP